MTPLDHLVSRAFARVRSHGPLSDGDPAEYVIEDFVSALVELDPALPGDRHVDVDELLVSVRRMIEQNGLGRIES